ncbi:MAG: signal peptidase II [Myxococcaceae bacterium]
MKILHRSGLVALILGLTIGCDQATKRVAESALRPNDTHTYLWDMFRFQLAENHGAFLSLGAGLPGSGRFWLLTVGVGLLLAGLLVYSLVNAKLTPLMVAAYALVVAGGLSNWVDRALNDGAVVDFMNMGIGPLRTGVFNVADLAIMGGIGILLVASWRHDRKLKATSPPASQ